MKARTLLVLALTLAALTLAVAAEDVSAQQKWKAVATSRPTPQFALWTWLGDELDKRTKGQVKLEVVSLPELGLTGFELVRVLRAGLVDLADVLPTYVSGDVPLIEGVDLPGFFSFDEFDKSRKAHVDWHRVMKANEGKLGGVFLGSYGYAYQVLFSRKPVQSLSDLKGMKIRVFGAAQTDFVRALGAEPVSLAVAEVYTALERGTVDAAITGTIAGFNLKWYEVTKHMVDLQMGPVMIGFVASKRSWDRVPADVKQALEGLGKELTEKGWDLAKSSTQEGIDGNKQRGMTWVSFKPEWQGAIRDAVQKSVLPNWVKRAGDDGKKAFNEVLAPVVGFTAQ